MSGMARQLEVVIWKYTGEGSVKAQRRCGWRRKCKSSKEMWMVLIHVTSFHGLSITNQISKDLCVTAV
jgi:hypothetical protein